MSLNCVVPRICPTDEQTTKFSEESPKGFTIAVDGVPAKAVLTPGGADVSPDEEVTIVSSPFAGDDFRVLELFFAVTPTNDSPVTVTVTFMVEGGGEFITVSLISL